MHLTGQQSVNKRDMKQLTIENFKAMLDNALKNIKEREDEFSKLDAVIGDGDHGQAIVTAMSAIVATAQKGTEFKAMLNVTATEANAPTENEMSRKRSKM